MASFSFFFFPCRKKVVLLHRQTPKASRLRVRDRTYKKDVVTAFICGVFESRKFAMEPQ